MAEYVVNASAVVPCGHGEQTGKVATAIPSGIVRVRLSGSGAVLMGDTAKVACTGYYPCTDATWSTGASRVKSMQRPLVLKTSQSIVVTSGLPLMGTAARTQARVKAT